MNKSILVSALLAMAMSGCTPNQPTVQDHPIEKTFRVQLLDGSGGVIREWIGVGDMLYEGNIPGGQCFTEKGTGKYVRVTGTVVVEQM